MMRFLLIAAAATLSVGTTPALAQAGNFALVNETAEGMRDLAIRRFGTQEWRPLAAGPAGAGSQLMIAFASPDCAFDIRAELASGTTAIWSGVNLCEVSVVRLNRGASGELWVEYN